MIIPICFPIDTAVDKLSPVIMMILIPADRHFFIAQGTDYLGGSMREISPIKMYFSIGKLKLSGFDVTKGYPL